MTTGDPGRLDPADREAIAEVFARRLYVMDMKRWDEYGPCHTVDVVSESWAVHGGAKRIEGREALTAAIRETLDGHRRVTSVHHGHSPILTATGPDPVTGERTAGGVWAMEDRLWWTGRDGTERVLHGWGHYRERYRCVGGEWLISYRRLERIRTEIGPAGRAV